VNASILDLRYRTRNILKALENRETVVVMFHGKPKGMIVPLQAAERTRVQDHPFFGMRAKEKRSVQDIMRHLRSGRHDL
jgi:antitoxin (DNA-binding transcriptional repressor) of toxin-antitoxin stability system